MYASPKYQVFISSTYEDLKHERDQVIKAVLEMGHIPVGMEMFSAADEQQWQIIARHIDQSDYYAVIVAHRLGSTTSEGISYTRKEYEYARSKGIPCLGFIISPDANWPAHWVDTTGPDASALADFKELIKEKPVGFWASAEDLHGKFSVALMKSVTAQPREGWVRASSASGGAAASAELVRLSSENSELRRRLDAAEQSAKAERSAEVRQTIEILEKSRRRPSYRTKPYSEWRNDSTVSLFDLFLWLGPEMVAEATIKNLSRTAAMNVRANRDDAWDTVAHNQTRVFVTDFMTLDLAQPSTRKHAVADTNEYWSLSKFGVEVLKHVRKMALTRSSETSEQSELSEPKHDNESAAVQLTAAQDLE